MTEQLRTRDEAPLSADDIVVRAGSMPSRTLTSGARACMARFGVYGISVAAGHGLSVEDLYRASRRLQLDGRYRQTSVGALQNLLGVELLPTFEAPHYTLVIPEPPSDEVWNGITGVFGPIQSAPQWGP